MILIRSIVWWLNRNAALLKRKDGKFIRVQERRLSNDVKRVFKQQMQYIIDSLKDLPVYQSASINKNSTNNDKIEQILILLPGQKKLVDSIIDNSSATLSKGGDRSMKDLKLKEFGISFSMKHPDAVAYLNAKRTLQLSNSKGTITDTTKTKLKEIISKGVDSGKSYTELANEIRQQGEAGVFSQARSELIAIREMGEAYETGRKVPVNEFVAKYPDRQMKKYWQTVNDSAVTEECAANQDEGWIDYNQNWSSGDSEPPRSSNPRCRCTCSYRIE